MARPRRCVVSGRVFAPAKNPDMWAPEVMAEVARHTNPGGTFATYTAAGAVRRALAEGGFERAARSGPRTQATYEHRAHAMTEQDTTKGIWLMVAVALIFALQDAFLAGIWRANTTC